MMKPPQNSAELKKELNRALDAGELTIGQATRRMRKIVGMTQKDYATRVLNITPRILMAIENDKGNPTLDTLKKIGKPFGYDIGFIKRK
ncbi:helix-turn-helix domain-containing protein [Motiliproteus sp. SC1-56]|uniref:helix-turn-helix domain-containing protein n=1 Tax=Motiliproteus sp. SC1-56 TaxID=2799565 RepID=UPI001A8F923A|nr:helix-turn-helix transcriptional regulator [Motiliproteus sp. SC1-56]